MNLISKEILRAEHEYMNMYTLPPINTLVTPLNMGKILVILPFFSSQSAEFGKRTPTKFPTKFPCADAHLAIGENLMGMPPWLALSQKMFENLES